MGAKRTLATFGEGRGRVDIQALDNGNICLEIMHPALVNVDAVNHYEWLDDPPTTVAITVVQDIESNFAQAVVDAIAAALDLVQQAEGFTLHAEEVVEQVSDWLLELDGLDWEFRELEELYE